MALDPVERFKATTTPQAAEALAKLEAKARKPKRASKRKSAMRKATDTAVAPQKPGRSPQELLDIVAARLGKRPPPSAPLGPDWGFDPDRPQLTEMGPGFTSLGISRASLAQSTT